MTATAADAAGTDAPATDTTATDTPATDTPDLASDSRVFGAFARHPQTATLVGAVCIAFSGILVRLAAVSPTTAATFRAGYALPFLLAVAMVERRRLGPRPIGQRAWAWLAGVFFGFDLVLFHHGIELMGAGLATVMGNVQVIFVAFIAWLLLHEKPSREQLTGIPVALFGVFLISGVVGSGAYGENPQLGVLVGLGTAASYAAYLLLIRRGRDRSRVAGPIFDASLACTVASMALGLISGDLNLLPTWPAHLWLFLLALSAQFAGGLLIAVALPRLPAVVTSLLLLSQPVMSVILAGLLLAEAPSAFQLLGVLLVLVGVVVGTVPFRSVVPALRRAGP